MITFTKPFVKDAHTNPKTLYPHLKAFCPDRDWSNGQEKPRCEDKDRTIISPYMYQAVTKIGRSKPHQHGSMSADKRGTKVCELGGELTCLDFFHDFINDSNFSWMAYFGREKDFAQGPTVAQKEAGVIPEEVHTQMLSLDLEPLWPPYNTEKQHQSANRVRAGDAAPDQARSVGEVESLSEDGFGFPGESFFGMNVEIDLDMDNYGEGDGVVDYTLINKKDDPLVIQGYGLQKFPPQLVYVHNSTLWAVPLFDKENEGKGHIAWVRMAGHGIIPGDSADSDWDARQGNRTKVDLPDFPDDIEKYIDEYMPQFEVTFMQMPALPIPPDEEPISVKEQCVGDDCPLQPPVTPPVCELTDTCDPPNLIALDFVKAFVANNKVFLVWETLSEMHNLGFHVLRAQKSQSEAETEYTLADNTPIAQIQQITKTLIPSRGISFWGISYFHADHNVQPGETYYYAIKDLDEDGKETVHLDHIVSVTIPPLEQ